MASNLPIQLTREQALAITDATTLLIFNEHNASKRKELMQKYWNTSIQCFSPFGAAEGYDGIEGLWEGIIRTLL